MIRSHPHKQRSHAVLYSLFGLGALAAGAREIRIGTTPGAVWFDGLWGVFALLTVGANLWFVFGVDKERQAQEPAIHREQRHSAAMSAPKAPRRAARG